MRLGIAGFGCIGQAVYAGLRPLYMREKTPKHKEFYSIEEKEFYVVIYDKYKDGYQNSFDDLILCDLIFVCLPTPTEDGEIQIKEFHTFLSKLDEANYRGVVVMRSTVLKDFSTLYNKLRFVYNPEFLDQNRAAEMFCNQKYIILGGMIDAAKHVAKAYTSMFNLPNFIEFKHCTIKEAIFTKYISNIYPALKISFWNYVNEVTGNYRKIQDLYNCALDQEGTPHNREAFKICVDGKPGFGGECLPKDLVAFNAEFPHDLTKFIIKYNKKLRPQLMKRYLKK